MAVDPSSGRDEGRWLVWTLLVAAAAFVLGVIGLAVYLPGKQRFLDLAYHSLQLFVLSSDPLQGNSPYNPLLEIARFLAPATTVYTVFRAFRSVVREGLRRGAIARLVGHTVVTGDSAASLVLAGHLRASGARVVLVGSEAAEVARRQGLLVVPGDAREITTLRAAGVRGASALYACAPQTATNAAVVLAAAEIDGRDQRLEAFARADPRPHDPVPPAPGGRSRQSRRRRVRLCRGRGRRAAGCPAAGADRGRTRGAVLAT